MYIYENSKNSYIIDYYNNICELLSVFIADLKTETFLVKLLIYTSK